MVSIQDVVEGLASVHAGELDAKAIGGISVLAGSLGRMFLPLIPKISEDDKKQRLVVMSVSAVALALYCREADIAVIGHGFTIISAYCVVGLATLGMFNLTNPDNFKKDNLKDFAHSASLGMVGTKAATDPATPGGKA